MVFSSKVPFQPPVEHFHEFSSQQPRKNDFPPQLVGAPRGWWFLQLCNGFLKLLYTGFVVGLQEVNERVSYLAVFFIDIFAGLSVD